MADNDHNPMHLTHMVRTILFPLVKLKSCVTVSELILHTDTTFRDVLLVGNSPGS